MLLEPGFETLKACVILEFALSVSLVRFGDVSSQLFPPGCLQSAATVLCPDGLLSL